jgi:RimJ/RimL family protein N-acetyltransferase
MPMPVIFATLDHVQLRGYRDSDKDRLFELWDNPAIQRTGPSPVAPLKPKLADEIMQAANEAVIWVIIEAREGEREAGGEQEAEDKFVGMCQLSPRSQKNRTAELGIALEPRWWGKGYGTEVLTWMVGHAFSELGLHRISLGVDEDNERAIKLYENV